MSRILTGVATVISLSACDFGALDHEFIALRMAIEQPANPDHGVLLNIEVFIDGSERLLAVSVRHGTIERSEAGAETAFCQLLQGQKSRILPLIILPADDEALLDVRLMKGSDPDNCLGTVIDSLVVPIAARPGAMEVDAGLPDAQ